MAERVVKVTLTATAKQYIDEFKKVQQQTKKTTDDAKANLQSQKEAMDRVGTAAVTMGTLAAAGLAYIIKTTADFDQQMSQVQSLSHATAAEMTQLRDAALEAGQGIGFTASEVADAETELVKAGVSVRDQLGGGLVGTLNLAAAGQMNVADATQIAASAMTQFKLEGKDVPHIADLLAAGADKALGSVSDLGQALKYVGPVAQSMGISIDQTVGTLALLAQNGILADQAGTSLRGMLQSLTSPSTIARKTMEKYSISLYDAQGNFIGLDGAAEQLKEHIGRLDQATRQQALGQIFGNEQITTATVLMQEGAAGVDKWTQSVNDQGFAAEQAAGKMDNLNGDLSKLGAAFDSAIIKSGSGANDILRELAQRATDLLSGIGKLPEPVLGAGVAVAGLVAGVGLLGGGFLLLIPRIAATRAAMAELNLTGKSLGVMVGKGSAILIGLTALASGLANTTSTAELSADKLAKVNDEMKHLTAAGLNEMFKDAGVAIIDGTDKADKFKESLNAIATGNFFENESGLTKFIDGATFGLTHLSDVYKTNEAQFRQIGTTLASTAKTSLGTATDQFALLVKTAGGGEEAIRQLLTVMPDYKAALIDLASQNGKTLSEQELFNLAVGKGDLAQKLAAASTVENSKTLSEMSGKADDATGSVSQLADALKDLGSGALDVSSAQIRMQQSIADATQAVKDNGATLELSTQKGRDNQSALDGIAQSAIQLASAQATAGASQADLTATVQQGRDAFVAAAIQMGLTSDQAQALADKYGLIPSNVNTIVNLQKSQAEKDAEELQGKLNNLTRRIDIAVQLHGPANLANYTGGAVPQAQGGILDFYAGGGIREKHVAQIAPAGSWRVWAEPETGGEAYIPLSPAKRPRSLEIWQATGRRLGVQGFADGGITYAALPPAAATTSVTVRTSDRPIYMDGQLFGILREMANGEAQIVLNTDKARERRLTGQG